MLDLASRLDLPLVAEGIETGDQLATLRRLGCPLGQGFLFARPQAAEDIEVILGAQREPRPVAA